jgi:hypothetical protein
MTRHNIPLGRILGIPIGLDYSWFVIFALLTWMLADSYYPLAATLRLSSSAAMQAATTRDKKAATITRAAWVREVLGRR